MKKNVSNAAKIYENFKNPNKQNLIYVNIIYITHYFHVLIKEKKHAHYSINIILKLEYLYTYIDFNPYHKDSNNIP